MSDFYRIITRLVDQDDIIGLLTAGNDGKYLKYDNASGLFELEDVAGGATAWGTITGTLSDQADLWAELGGKALTVHTHAISDVTGLQTELDGKAPIDGVTGDFSVGGTLEVDTIQFDLTPEETLEIGGLQWGGEHGTLALKVTDNVTLDIGQELYMPPCKAGEDLVDGDAVYVSGNNGPNAVVSKAQADTFATSWVAGVATETVNAPNFIKITTYGAVHGVDTSAFSEGDPLYLSATVAGALTNVRPTAPNIASFVALCTYSHANQGIIIVRPDLIPQLQRLSDVYTASLSDGQILAWNATNSRFENVSNIPGFTGIDDYHHIAIVSGAATQSPWRWESGSDQMTLYDTRNLDLYGNASGTAGDGDFRLRIGSRTTTGDYGTILWKNSENALVIGSGAAERLKIPTSGATAIGFNPRVYSGFGVTLSSRNANLTDIDTTVRIFTEPNGTAGDGFGGAISWGLEDSTNANRVDDIAHDYVRWLDATAQTVERGWLDADQYRFDNNVYLTQKGSLGNDLVVANIVPTLLNATEASYTSKLAFAVRDYNDYRQTLVIEATGSGALTRIGDLENSNTTEIEADGTLKFNGDATTFDDVVGSLISKRLLSNAGTIDYNFTENSITFSQNGDITNDDDVMNVNQQLPHSARLGTGATIDPHIHFWQDSTTAYIFTLRYRIQKNNAAKTTTWTEITATVGTDTLYTYTSGTLNQILIFPSIDVATAGISATIQFRMTRSDSLGGTVDATFFDFHVESNTFGSRTRYTK